MATSFASLGTDHVGAYIKAFLDVFWVSDHVHVEDTGFVKAFDNVFRWNPDGGDEKFGARVDDDRD